MSRKYRYVIRYSAVYDNFRNQRDGLNLKVGNVRLGLPELPPESGMITIYRSLVSVPLPFPLTVFFFFFSCFLPILIFLFVSVLLLMSMFSICI